MNEPKKVTLTDLANEYILKAYLAKLDNNKTKEEKFQNALHWFDKALETSTNSSVTSEYIKFLKENGYSEANALQHVISKMEVNRKEQ